MTLAELQRHYVEIFDMRRRCSLFLTSWTHGDTRNRGMALIYFKELYKNAGVTMSEEELPDHLAVVLEFAALVDPIEGNLLLGEHRAPIELIRDALHAAHSVYAHILDSVVTTLPPMTAEIQERARAIALSGPPQEFVGLSGAVSIALEPFSAFPSLERTHK
jgi:nitrate reductase delta subunit